MGQAEGRQVPPLPLPLPLDCGQQLVAPTPLLAVAEWGGQFGGHQESGSGMARPLPGLPGKVLAAPWIRGAGVESTGRTCHAGVEDLGESTLRSLGTASHRLPYGRQWQPLEAFSRQDF